MLYGTDSHLFEMLHISSFTEWEHSLEIGITWRIDGTFSDLVLNIK